MIAFLVAAGLVSAVALAADAVPKVRIQETDVDFGKIEAGKSETKTITIRNIGDSKLEIRKLETNSTSVIPTAVNSTVEPNGEGKIEIKFDSTGIEPCRLIKYVYVYTDDPDLKDRSIAVTCRATIVPLSKPTVQLEPYELDLGVVNPGETVKRTITYRNVGSADLKVEPIQYLDRRCKVTKNITEHTLAPGQSGSFEISFKGENPGKIDSFILLKSDSAEGPYSKITITGEIAERNINIKGLTRIETPEGSQAETERYKIDFANYFAPYKVKVTLLNGISKDTAFTLDENRSMPRFIDLDPEEPGKTISIRLDIVMEEPAQPEESGEDEEPGATEPSAEDNEPEENTEDNEDIEKKTEN
jgi:hypothetical protein